VADLSSNNRAIPQLSVILPCRNGQEHLAEQLEALASQVTSFPWEVVFVDNGSSDRSRQIAEQYQARMRLRVVPAPIRANRSYARNVGTEAAVADKLVFVDADDAVAPGFLSAMAEMLKEHDFIAAPRDEDALNPSWVRVAQRTSESSHGTFAPFAFGSGLAVTRHVLESVGGWPEQYAVCEDMALSFRIQRAGIAVASLAEPAVRYRLRASIRGLFGQTRRWGYYAVLVHRDFGEAFVPRRPLSLALSEWLGIVRELVSARSRSQLGRFAVRLGYSVGRLQASVRHRVFYL
jgi:glycosyltransferase involved in cell wall biosynthesis